MEPNYILLENADCNFPPFPNLNSVEEPKTDDDDEESKTSIFQSEDEYEELYEVEPVVDAWKAPSWDSEAVHRCDGAVITNLYALESNDYMQSNCNNDSKNLSKDNKVVLKYTN